MGFSGIDTADEGGGGRWFVPGHYLVAVRKLLLKVSKRPATAGQEIFIAEFEIMESSVADYQPGDSVTWVQKMVPKEMALPPIKALAVALVGRDAPITADVMDALVGPEQPCAGLRVRVEAYHVPTQAGGLFTKLRFDAVAPSLPTATPGHGG